MDTLEQGGLCTPECSGAFLAESTSPRTGLGSQHRSPVWGLPFPTQGSQSMVPPGPTSPPETAGSSAMPRVPSESLLAGGTSPGFTHEKEGSRWRNLPVLVLPLSVARSRRREVCLVTRDAWVGWFEFHTRSFTSGRSLVKVELGPATGAASGARDVSTTRVPVV